MLHFTIFRKILHKVQPPVCLHILATQLLKLGHQIKESVKTGDFCAVVGVFEKSSGFIFTFRKNHYSH